MKFMLLINLGSKARDYKSLTEDEQKAIAAGYQAINETPGVTPGNQLQPPEAAITVRMQDGKTRTTGARSSRRRKRSTATASSRPTTSTRRSSWRRGSPV
jgi:hypothetical protein